MLHQRYGSSSINFYSASSAPSDIGFKIYEDDDVSNNNSNASNNGNMNANHSSNRTNNRRTPNLKKPKRTRQALQSLGSHTGASRKAQLEAWRKQKRGAPSSTKGIENTSPPDKCLHQSAKTAEAGEEKKITHPGSPSSVPRIAGMTIQNPDVHEEDADSDPLFCSIYTFKKGAETQWRKRGNGKGEISFVPALSNQISLQVRARNSLKLLANFTVGKSTKIAVQSSRSWTISAEDFSRDCQGSWTKFLLRFSSSDDAKIFQARFEAFKTQNRAQASEKLLVPASTAVIDVGNQGPDISEIKLLKNKVAELESQLHQERTQRELEAQKYKSMVASFRLLVEEAEEPFVAIR